jgi:hypothetical protein
LNFILRAATHCSLSRVPPVALILMNGSFPHRIYVANAKLESFVTYNREPVFNLSQAN